MPVAATHLSVGSFGVTFLQGRDPHTTYVEAALRDEYKLKPVCRQYFLRHETRTYQKMHPLRDIARGDGPGRCFQTSGKTNDDVIDLS